MSDYDFKTLNDKEFEIICADLLGEVLGRRFERFKAGKDAGIDGRYFLDDGNEVILQVKHWSNTPLSQLIRELKVTEKPKLNKLKPVRYLLAISNPLSRADKKSISHALDPHIKSESDIFGKEDLNDLLKSRPDIEQRHYKLWLHSSSVLNHIQNNAILGRSSFSLEEIIHFSSRYVVTANHEKALNILEILNVVIITGEPGVGKTTLADHLCLHYVAQGYTYLKIDEDIREAESVFNPDTKQIFYFDDFLGRNYLEALRGHEGSQITQFIKRISASKNKKFVLTSRSTILNQGTYLIDSFEHANTKRNEYELKIQLLTDMDKAHILYNHIWHSNLEKKYIDELYKDKRYRAIIKHQNFNPRLISYITDPARLDACPPENYWDFIIQSLTNPSQVWENPFEVQQDDFGRAIVMLTVFNGGNINENALSQAYHRFISLPENQHLKGRPQFRSNIRLLCGSFLNRDISFGGSSTIDLFNPSIGDYILKRYSGDVVAVRLAMLSLITVRSIETLRSLKDNKNLTITDTRSICMDMLDHFSVNSFTSTSVEYLSALFDLLISCGGLDASRHQLYSSIVRFILANGQGNATDFAFQVIEWGLKQEIISYEETLDFVKNNIEAISADWEIMAAISLLEAIPSETHGHIDILKSFNQHVFELVSDNLADCIDVTEAFSNAGYEDHDCAYTELYKLLEKYLSDIGIEFSKGDIVGILNSYDYAYEHDKYYENSNYFDDDRVSTGPSTLAIDQIDDLFDKS
jgi:adenylate kinase family enzyme